MNTYRSSFLSLLTVFLASVFCAPVMALNYWADVDKSEWKLEASLFECRMWQPIPFYGDAVFRQQAGDEQEFYLSPLRRAMRSGKASLTIKAPVWNPGKEPLSLGYVPVRETSKPIHLKKQLATRLLTELYDGMAPEFQRQSWYGDDVSIQVGLSSANFRAAYRKYQQCLAELLPVNFEQIARTRVHFDTAKATLRPETKERLDIIARYAKADGTVNEFVVDGHTDTVGRQLYNVELSKQRAEAVTAYLIKQGVDKSLIVTRYFGERFPIANNATPANRAKNRRVTIRLERDLL